MPPPSQSDLDVATASLRTEATVWGHQGEQIAAIAPKAEGLKMPRPEAGIFQLMVSAYDEVVDMVAGRCREGSQRMAEIASTLRHVADTYEDEERHNEHKFRNLY